MSARYTGISLKEHRRIARVLVDTMARFQEFESLLAAAYGTSSKEHRKVISALYKINQLRAQLDETIVREHPEQSRKELRQYYYPSEMDDGQQDP